MADKVHLIPPQNRGKAGPSYGSVNSQQQQDQGGGGDGGDHHFEPISLKNRAWSFQEGRRSTALPTSAEMNSPKRQQNRSSERADNEGNEKFFYYVVYALVNVIISAPGLYGYAAVIFNNPIFASSMNALSKLVLFSSLVHQLGFLLFSTLDFAIGTVQDAGLIFLSHMANILANTLLEEAGFSAEGLPDQANMGEELQHVQQVIVSTTIVLLSLSTAALGLVLVIMGKFRLADAVSYLPMPVVGGYLAFIGYFCCQAGVALCVSEPLITFSDWAYLFKPQAALLALPGLVAGLVLTVTSRVATNSGVLPIVMVLIPASFYLILYLGGLSMEDARETGWVGPEAPAVPVQDLFRLVDFSLVRWDLAPKIFSTWVGMIFVVSFASCLDVAAISMDMGEALDTNKELATVGICNFMSGLTFGFTGSYIFSQTIFTYRTGVHSRWIGGLIMVVFFYIVVSPVNMLEISPLFFLGSTLIFIGYDLLYEWLWEVRHQVFLTEYGIIWLTFVAIQVVGIDAGIVLGIFIAIIEQVVLTARTSSINRITKTSRAVWTPADTKLLHDHAYSNFAPKIVTLEVIGTVFFGSALNLLNCISDEIGLGEEEQFIDSPGILRSPHISATMLRMDSRPSIKKTQQAINGSPNTRKRIMAAKPPHYLVLDLMSVSNLDASATRGCFLQLVKMCAKKNITVCASGVTPRIEWMLRSHKVSIETVDAEAEFKATHLSRLNKRDRSFEQILLFNTLREALEFCETDLIHSLNLPNHSASLTQIAGPEEQSLADVMGHLLGANSEEQKILTRLEGERYHTEETLMSGGLVFHKNIHADSFYTVLQGCIANTTSAEHLRHRQQAPVVSGAGLVKPKRTSSRADLVDTAFLKRQASSEIRNDTVGILWPVGGVFGYLDFLLERPRHFEAIATVDGTRVAKFTHSDLNLLQNEDPELYAVMQRVLLRASSLDLGNCTCSDV